MQKWANKSEGGELQEDTVTMHLTGMRRIARIVSLLAQPRHNKTIPQPDHFVKKEIKLHRQHLTADCMIPPSHTLVCSAMDVLKYHLLSEAKSSG